MGHKMNDSLPQQGRAKYDLSSLVFQVGKISQLQTLKTIPVVAGDSMRFNLGAVLRTAALRRHLYCDMNVQFFGFYIPHRHVYGADWLTFVKSGVKEAVTFGSRTFAGDIESLGTHLRAGTVPKFYPQGYVNIYNRYFAPPSYPTAQLADAYFDSLTTENSAALYGASACWLPRVWNTPVVARVVDADKRISLVDTDKIDLVDFAQKQGTLETMRQREFFASSRYVDVLGNMFGATVGVDADQRPELLFHTEDWISAKDVDGTDDASLGTGTSKAFGTHGLNMPWKFFPEHGLMWIMCLVRFPAIHVDERHYLAGKPEPTWLQIGGEPNLWRRQAPEVLNMSEWISGSTLTDAGVHPYGQWYREDNHHVHSRYKTIQGHPFIEEGINTVGRVYVPSADEYDNVFNSPDEMGHWQLQGAIDCEVKRVVPDPRNSIFSGSI